MNKYILMPNTRWAARVAGAFRGNVGMLERLHPGAIEFALFSLRSGSGAELALAKGWPVHAVRLSNSDRKRIKAFYRTEAGLAWLKDYGAEHPAA